MRFLSFLGLFVLLSLTGCGRSGTDVPLTRYELPEKAGGRICSNQCRNAFDHCMQACNLNERSCYNDTQEQAIRDYDAYAREQFLSRAPTTLRPRDFERNGQCVSMPCRKACKSNYDSCFNDCGGNIITGTSCQFLCF